jgi:RNA polymerase sigma-70 factor (ECF subfamily)
VAIRGVRVRTVDAFASALVMTADLERLPLSEPFARVEAEEPTLADWFRRFAPYVARIGYRLLGRDEEVDDLVQDVFMAAHRTLGELSGEGAVRAWLMTVAVRTARKRLRRRALLQFLHLDAVPEPPVDAAPSAELALVQSTLDRLPIAERIAWVLHHVEGETLERVAEVCGCSLATVKRRIRSAATALEARRGA